MSVRTIDPTTHRVLFLDDWAVEGTVGLRRVVNALTDRRPVIVAQGAQVATQTRSGPMWNSEQERWECWYWASHPCEPYGPWLTEVMHYTHLATSTDGVTWEYPELGWYDNPDPTAPNNVAVDPALGFRALYHILRDETDPDPARRYKALFGNHNRQPMVSPDGRHWTALDAPPIPSSDESHLVHDVAGGRFLAYVKRGTQWGRSVFLSESTDFAHWTVPQLVLHADEQDHVNAAERIARVVADPAYLSPPIVDACGYAAETYQMGAMAYEGLYIGFPLLFNPAGAIPPPQTNFTGLNQVELTVSRDGYQWERVADRQVFVGVEPWDGTNYGTAQTTISGTPVVVGDEMRFYCGAYRFRGQKELYPKEIHPYFADQGAICLATLPRDRFVAMRADAGGQLVTRPFAAQPGQRLHVNADAAGGSLRAELLDGYSLKPIDGYGPDACEAITTDTLDTRLQWTGSTKLPDSLRLRFHLDAASLYSFWLRSD